MVHPQNALNLPYPLQALLPQIVALAEDAGKAIMKTYSREDFGTTAKEDNSPLTHADMASHDLILADLRTLTPDLPVLSEESKGVSHAERRSWHTFWLIDPLDGTKEFIKRNGEFTVNIALIKGGHPVLGVVHAPVLRVAYFAAHGIGAFKRSSEGQEVRIAVSDYRQTPLKLVASRSHGGEALAKFLEKLGPVQCISMGSSLKICLVADGSAHLYPRLGPTMEWDTAAAHCVLEQAGGTVTDLQGHTLFYNKPDLLNPYFMASTNPPPPWQDYLQKDKHEKA